MSVRWTASPDGIAEITTGSNAGMPATVKVYDVSTPTPRVAGMFRPIGPKFTGGVTLSTGRWSTGSTADILVGAGVGGGSVIEVWSGATFARLDRITAFSAFRRPNAEVYAAALDFDGNGIVDTVSAVQGQEGAKGTPGVTTWSPRGARFPACRCGCLCSSDSHTWRCAPRRRSCTPWRTLSSVRMRVSRAARHQQLGQLLDTDVAESREPVDGPPGFVPVASCGARAEHVDFRAVDRGFPGGGGLLGLRGQVGTERIRHLEKVASGDRRGRPRADDQHRAGADACRKSRRRSADRPGHARPHVAPIPPSRGRPIQCVEERKNVEPRWRRRRLDEAFIHRRAMLFVDTLTIIAAVDGRVSTTELGAIESIVARRGMSVRTEEVDAWVNTAVAWMKAKDVPAFANEVRDRLAPHRGTRFLDDVLEALVEISKHDGAVQENEVRVIDWFRKQFAS